MDFGLCPPPTGLPANGSGITADANFEELLTFGNNYHYRGPDGLFLNNVLAVSVPILLIWLLKRGAVSFSTAERIGIWLVAIVLILLVFHWVEISADDSKLTIRKHLFGKCQVITVADITQAKIYSQRSTRGYVTKFLGINLRAGKSFDLFLPKKKQTELAAFIKCRTGA